MHKQAIKHKQAIIGGGYLFTENACFNTNVITFFIHLHMLNHARVENLFRRRFQNATSTTYCKSNTVGVPGKEMPIFLTFSDFPDLTYGDVCNC